MALRKHVFDGPPETWPRVWVARQPDDVVVTTDMLPPGYGDLVDRLLALGGHNVVVQEEPDLRAILERGRSFGQAKRVLRKGCSPSQCHTNTAARWAQEPKRYRIATGYALNEDRWRQHTWLVEGRRAVDTTYRPERYYGFILSPAEADDFARREGLDPPSRATRRSRNRASRNPIPTEDTDFAGAIAWQRKVYEAPDHPAHRIQFEVYVRTKELWEKAEKVAARLRTMSTQDLLKEYESVHADEDRENKLTPPAPDAILVATATVAPNEALTPAPGTRAVMEVVDFEVGAGFVGGGGGLPEFLLSVLFDFAFKNQLTLVQSVYTDADMSDLADAWVDNRMLEEPISVGDPDHPVPDLYGHFVKIPEEEDETSFFEFSPGGDRLLPHERRS